MDELLQSVIEAATWIDKVNPRFEDNFYRSEELRPTSHLLNRTGGYNSSCLHDVVLRRRQLLQGRLWPLLSLAELQTKGRLVLAAPEVSVTDGASAAESLGYFDSYELAPWDTWVAFAAELPSFPEHDTYIISWVPNQLLQAVQGGIDVCFLGNINWLGQLTSELPSHPILRILFASSEGLAGFAPVSYDAVLQKRLKLIDDQWAVEELDNTL
jgi:hypothetical protein